MEAAGVNVLGMGLLVTVLPFALKATPMAAVSWMLWPLGLLLLVGGAGLLFVARKKRALSVPISALDGESDVIRQDQTPAKRSPKGTSSAVAASTPARPAEVPAAAEPEGRPDRWSPAVFDMIEWRRFEAVVEALFKQAGFETKSQSHGADGGVDIWLYSRNQPGAPVSLVQCKHWQGKKVGVDKIRELRGVMAAQNVKRGQFATTSTFTADAMAFASENGVNLLSVDKLLQLIASRTPEQQAELLTVALEGEYWRPTCVNCGVKMVDRVPRNGGAPFWGCPSFPKCKTTLPMRSA
ncbi:restriction endonuclease [Pelomonas sp. APW6]|uniref:Restriction endonuclease n=1 Tax=Roseateles subflavus TaxID=3053353 RepID=A0ABT7LI60_9BURK|nr:restriction endonuclease [Pelomonas sp. APW6]MDL5032541.1 restriction endonuclease [Pelomonas sp. APW6]